MSDDTKCPKCGASYPVIDESGQVDSSGAWACGTKRVSGGYNIGFTCLCRQFLSMAERTEKAEAIVAKLPLTADGEPITDGMELFQPPGNDWHDSDIMSPVVETKVHWVNGYGAHIVDDNWSRWYSTQEAADAAKKSEVQNE